MSIPNYHKPEDPSKVKAYNHEQIGSGKPVMSNLMFKALLESIDNGHYYLIEDAEKNYGLDETQQTLLNNRKRKPEEFL